MEEIREAESGQKQEQQSASAAAAAPEAAAPEAASTSENDRRLATTTMAAAAAKIPSSPPAGVLGDVAGKLCQQPDWIKGVRGIQTFQANYKPGTLSKAALTWDPRVWENEQAEMRRKAEEEKRKAEQAKIKQNNMLKLRKVRWLAPQKKQHSQTVNTNP